MRKLIVVSTAALALGLAGCEDRAAKEREIDRRVEARIKAEHAQEQQKIYKNVAECEADDANKDKATCKVAFAESEKALPRYTAKAQCEAQYGTGNCESRSESHGGGGGGFFVPAMVGFMVGQALANNAHAYQPVYVGNGGGLYAGGRPLGYNATPVYDANGNRHYSAPRSVVVNNNYGASVPTTAPATAKPDVKRGGFGATQAAQPVAPSDSYTASRPSSTYVPATRPKSGYSSGSSSRGGFGGRSGGGRSGGGFG